MYIIEMKGNKYTIGHSNGYSKHQKCLIPVDKKDLNEIPINNFGNLSYMVRSSQVSEAIQEWEACHNTKLMPRN